ncbi:hypothetical protein, partial [Sphingopyxis sp. SCN 67-31]|uniref:hypothetical protein n=1 Tax=Sphingopyxis sp. SCN 67-31 TaxID=1660142 RepID=UPI00258032F8
VLRKCRRCQDRDCRDAGEQKCPDHHSETPCWLADFPQRALNVYTGQQEFIEIYQLVKCQIRRASYLSNTHADASPLIDFEIFLQGPAHSRKEPTAFPFDLLMK